MEVCYHLLIVHIIAYVQGMIFSKKELKQVIYDAFTNYGIARASELADEMKELESRYNELQRRS